MGDKPFYVVRVGFDISLRVLYNDYVLAKWSVRDGETWAYQQAENLCNVLNDVAERFAEQRIRPLRSILNACHVALRMNSPSEERVSVVRGIIDDFNKREMENGK